MLDKDLIFHIATREDWEKARQNGEYTADAYQTKGYIQCFTKDQILPTANEKFHNQKALLILYIDPKEVAAKIVTKAKHPCIEGTLSRDAVVRVVTMNPQEDGSFILPPDLL